MRIENLRVQDILLSSGFLIDYDLAPSQVREKVDDLIRTLATGTIPNSFRAHKARSFGLWIGWVGTGNVAWRVLFTVDFATGVLTFEHLENHGRTEKRWKRHVGN